MKYNKLVRDKIPEYIKSRGGKPVTHIAGNEEYWRKLREKLQEEVNEFLEAESPQEIADIYEVLDAMCDWKQFDRNQVQDIKKTKLEERGGFQNRIILDES
jgi:predicted house-cleaning noncanonical NTP pyrophosphatase (MazG superfamily)